MSESFFGFEFHPFVPEVVYNVELAQDGPEDDESKSIQAYEDAKGEFIVSAFEQLTGECHV